MKKIGKILFTIVAFIGLFGYKLAAANETSMFLDINEDEIIHNMAGVEYQGEYDDEPDDEDLEGLGRILRSGKYSQLAAWRKRMQAGRRTRKRRRRIQKTRIITPTMNYIVGNKKKLGPEAQKFINDGKGSFTDGIIYFAKEYEKLGSMTEIIKTKDKFDVGYSNLEPNGIVPIQNTMAATFVGFLFNQFDSATENLFTNNFVKAYNDPRFANSELDVVVGNETVLTLHVSMMQETRHFKGSIPATEHCGYNLEKPLLIPGNKSLNFVLRMADGTSVENAGTERTGVKFFVAGSATKS